MEKMHRATVATINYRLDIGHILVTNPTLQAGIAAALIGTYDYVYIRILSVCLCLLSRHLILHIIDYICE